MTEVILVDENDKEIGVKEKIAAHKDGDLHRSFSIFIFNTKGELLMQKRHPEKYHSGNLWSNTCCGHPFPGEMVLDAARRRLKEELGFEAPLSKLFTFTYKVEFDNDLTENEFDHTFVGEFSGEPQSNPREVVSVKWKQPRDILADMELHPKKYTYWFKIALQKMME